MTTSKNTIKSKNWSRNLLLASALLSSSAAIAQNGFFGKLDGDVISTSNISELNAADGFTFETQVYLDELTTWTNLMGQVDASSNRAQLQVHNGKLYCLVANGTNTFKYTPSAVLSKKTWHKIAMTYDGTSSDKCKVYVDGVAVSLNSGWLGAPGASAPTTSANFKVSNGKINGYIDNVRVWDEVLSQTTLNAWSDKTVDASHPNYTNLVLNWDFEDRSSSTSVAATAGTSYSGSVSSLDYDRQFVGTYIPYYAMSRVTAETAQNSSHMFYFSFGPNAAGELGRVNGSGAFTHIDSLGKVPSDIATLNSWRVGLNTKLIMVVGGWVQSDYLDEALANSTSRANLVTNIKDFIDTYGLDGVDIDWEGYKGAVNTSHYSLFLQELQTAFAGTDLEISATIGAHDTAKANIFEQHADYVQLMTYGRVFGDGTQYPLSTLKTTVNDWVSAGLSEDKLVVGLPAYSRSPTVTSPNSIPYRTIVADYAPAPSVDSIAINGGYHYFNGLDTIEDKSVWAKSEGLKGVMMWDQGQDVLPTEPESIIVKMAETIGLNSVD